MSGDVDGLDELSERIREVQALVSVLRREHDRIDGPAKRIGMHSWVYAPHFASAISAAECEVEEIRARLEESA